MKNNCVSDICRRDITSDLQNLTERRIKRYTKNNLRQSQPFPKSDQLNHLGLHASEEYNYLKKIPPEGDLNNFSHIEN